jgi:hypothetical protein
MAEASLTEDEQSALDLTVQLVDMLAGIVGEGPTRAGDLNELLGHVHGIQNAVMAQAAARAYPGRFRLLGQTLLTG